MAAEDNPVRMIMTFKHFWKRPEEKALWLALRRGPVGGHGRIKEMRSSCITI